MVVGKRRTNFQWWCDDVCVKVKVSIRAGRNPKRPMFSVQQCHPKCYSALSQCKEKGPNIYYFLQLALAPLILPINPICRSRGERRAERGLKPQRTLLNYNFHSYGLDDNWVWKGTDEKNSIFFCPQIQSKKSAGKMNQSCNEKAIDLIFFSSNRSLFHISLHYRGVRKTSVGSAFSLCLQCSCIDLDLWILGDQRLPWG